MKIALTGAGGMLGHAVRQVFSDTELIEFTRNILDITSLDNAVSILRSTRPDYVIHAAAFTDVDRCESEPEKAYLVNSIGTRNITIACEEIKAPIIYISTDYVFDGKKASPYDEWDETNPINKYGISKMLGERFVISMTNRFHIVRTSWLYGSNGRNFVDTIIRLLSEKDYIEVVNDQTGCPTYTIDLAIKLKELIGRGYGIYHITNTGNCTWYDFAVKIAEIKGIRKNIIPVTSDRFIRPARRPSYSVLGNTMLRLEGISLPRKWDEALAEYISN